MNVMKKILLHTCCAPCAIYVAKQLAKEYEVALFYYNPNIHPADEYQKRLQEIIKWAEKEKVELIEAKYNPEFWFKKIKGLELEPEGGERCWVCYELRLKQTAQHAEENGFDVFTSTMSISPHKNADKLNEIGEYLAKEYKVDYLASDWKKNEGFKIACQLSKQEDFYRQDYCGCVFSQNNKNINK